MQKERIYQRIQLNIFQAIYKKQGISWIEEGKQTNKNNLEKK